MTRETLAHRVSQAGFGLACLMPLLMAIERVPMEIGVGFIGFFFLLYSFAARDWAWTKSDEMRAMFVLWLYLLASALLRFDQISDGHVLQTVLWVRYLLLYGAVRHWLLNDPARRMILVHVVVYSLIFIVIDAFWQYATGVSLLGRRIGQDNRLTGMLRHPNVGILLLKMMIVPLGFLIQCALSRGQRPIAVAYALLGCALCGFIPLTGERSTLLLLLLALFVLAVGLFTARRRWRMAILAAAAAMTMYGAAIVETQPYVHQRMTMLEQQIESFHDTVYGQIYLAAFEIWYQSPWFGVGKKNFYEACLTLQSQGNITYCDVHPHNIYLQWLAEQGLFGFTLLLVTLGLIVARGCREGRACVAAGSIVPFFSLASIAVLLFPLIVTQSHFSNWPAIVFWYALAMTLALQAPITERKKP